MPVYGDVAIVRKMLRSTDAHELGSDLEDRYVALNAAVSSALEEACERTWGVPVTDTTALVWAGPGDVIVLPRPARTITSITYGGTLTGSTMTGGTTITAPGNLYNAIIDRKGLIYAIKASTVNVWWWNWELLTPTEPQRVPILVTGDFVDSDDDATVPADITYIASYCIAERLKVEKASSFGAIGPDGTVAPIRDVFADPLVKRIIAKYKREMAWAV